MSEHIPLWEDERIVTCGPHMKRRVQRQHGFESWQTYATPEQLLAGEFGRIDTVRLVCPVETPDEQ